MYFPKSQIKTDLYTNGEEFTILKSNTPYVGSYYSVSSGKFYTGKNPNDGGNFELVPNYSEFNPNLNSDSPITFDNEIPIDRVKINIIKPTEGGDFDADDSIEIPFDADWRLNQENNNEYYNLKQTT